MASNFSAPHIYQNHIDKKLHPCFLGLRVAGNCVFVSFLDPLGWWTVWHAFLIVMERMWGERKTDRSICLQPACGLQTLPSVRRVRAWNVNHILWPLWTDNLVSSRATRTQRLLCHKPWVAGLTALLLKVDKSKGKHLEPILKSMWNMCLRGKSGTGKKQKRLRR